MKLKTDSLHIRKICEKYIGANDLHIESLNNVQNFYIDSNTKLGWCAIPKVVIEFQIRKLTDIFTIAPKIILFLGNNSNDFGKFSKYLFLLQTQPNKVVAYIL